MAFVECVPNISEGRRLDIVEAMATSVREARGVHLLDQTSDPDHNRSVLTLAGAPTSLTAAVLALFDAAIAAIDLRTHRGVHPRVGAVDVVPFVPVGNVTMTTCVELARDTAAEVARRFEIPVYLYEEAAVSHERRNLADIRRGQFEGLTEKLQSPGWAPDFGPRRPHPTAGATIIGARRPLVAFNVNLDTDQLDVAVAIARAVRHRDGGLPFVKAMGVPLVGRGLVQVSMNLTNVDVTPPHLAFEAVQAEARRRGVRVHGSELIGLMPASAVAAAAAAHLQLSAFGPAQVLETRVLDAELREHTR